MFEFRGKEYKSFAECCRKYNVPVNGGLRSYAQYHNVTRQQALEDFLKNNHILLENLSLGGNYTKV